MSTVRKMMKIKYLPLLLIVAFLPLASGGFDHPAVYAAVALGTLFVALFFLRAGRGLEFREIVREPIFYYLLYLAYSLVRIPFALDPHRALYEVLLGGLYAAVYFLAVGSSVRELERITRIMEYLAGGLALLAIVQVFGGEARPSATLANPNPFATFMGMMLCHIWAGYLDKRSPFKFGLAVLVLGAIWLSGSRGALLFLLPGLAVLSFVFKNNRFKHRRRFVFFLVLVLVSLFVASSTIKLAHEVGKYTGEDNIFTSVARPESIDKSTGGRFAFWRASVDAWQGSKVFGYGPGSTFLTYGLVPEGSPYFSRFTHNDYLQVLVEGGIIGLALYLAFIGLIIYRVVSRLRAQRVPRAIYGPAAALCFFLLHITVEFSWDFPAVTVLFFFFLGSLSRGMLRCRQTKSGQREVIKTALSVFFTLVFLLNLYQMATFLVYLRGNALIADGEAERAIKVYERVNVFYPFNAAAFEVNGDLWLEEFALSRGEDVLSLARSRQALESAVRLSPVRARFRGKLAFIYQLEGRATDAEHEYLAALEYGRYQLEHHLRLARLYELEGRMAEAEGVLQEGIRRSEEPDLELFYPGDLEAERRMLVEAITAMHN